MTTLTQPLLCHSPVGHSARKWNKLNVDVLADLFE